MLHATRPSWVGIRSQQWLPKAIKGHQFLFDIKNAVDNRLILEPGWFEAMCIHPPPVKEYRSGRLEDLDKIWYPEDELREQYLAKNSTKALFWVNRAIYGDLFWEKSPADLFARRQQDLIDRGYPKKIAYEFARREERLREMILEKECSYAQLQALKMGIDEQHHHAYEAKKTMRRYSEKLALFSAREKSRAREMLQNMITIRKEEQNTTPLSAEELKDIRPEIIEEHLQVNPDDEYLFTYEATFRLPPPHLVDEWAADLEQEQGQEEEGLLTEQEEEEEEGLLTEQEEEGQLLLDKLEEKGMDGLIEDLEAEMDAKADPEMDAKADAGAAAFRKMVVETGIEELKQILRRHGVDEAGIDSLEDLKKKFEAEEGLVTNEEANTKVKDSEQKTAKFREFKEILSSKDWNVDSFFPKKPQKQQPTISPFLEELDKLKGLLGDDNDDDFSKAFVQVYVVSRGISLLHKLKDESKNAIKIEEIAAMKERLRIGVDYLFGHLENLKEKEGLNEEYSNIQDEEEELNEEEDIDELVKIKLQPHRLEIYLNALRELFQEMLKTLEQEGYTNQLTRFEMLEERYGISMRHLEELETYWRLWNRTDPTPVQSDWDKRRAVMWTYESKEVKDKDKLYSDWNEELDLEEDEEQIDFRNTKEIFRDKELEEALNEGAIFEELNNPHLVNPQPKELRGSFPDEVDTDELRYPYHVKQKVTVYDLMDLVRESEESWAIYKEFDDKLNKDSLIAAESEQQLEDVPNNLEEKVAQENPQYLNDQTDDPAQSALDEDEFDEDELDENELDEGELDEDELDEGELDGRDEDEFDELDEVDGLDKDEMDEVELMQLKAAKLNEDEVDVILDALESEEQELRKEKYGEKEDDLPYAVKKLGLSLEEYEALEESLNEEENDLIEDETTAVEIEDIRAYKAATEEIERAYQEGDESILQKFPEPSENELDLLQSLGIDEREIEPLKKFAKEVSEQPEKSTEVTRLLLDGAAASQVTEYLEKTKKLQAALEDSINRKDATRLTEYLNELDKLENSLVENDPFGEEVESNLEEAGLETEDDVDMKTDLETEQEEGNVDMEPGSEIEQEEVDNLKAMAAALEVEQEEFDKLKVMEAENDVKLDAREIWREEFIEQYSDKVENSQSHFYPAQIPEVERKLNYKGKFLLEKLLSRRYSPREAKEHYERAAAEANAFRDDVMAKANVGIAIDRDPDISRRIELMFKDELPLTELDAERAEFMKKIERKIEELFNPPVYDPKQQERERDEQMIQDLEEIANLPERGHQVEDKYLHFFKNYPTWEKWEGVDIREMRKRIVDERWNEEKEDTPDDDDGPKRV